jgi:protein involved in polysaccharide export with SLBB domain
MHTTQPTWTPWLLLTLGLLSLTGCTGGAGMSLFPSGNELEHATKKLVQPIPVHIPRELEKEPLPPFTVEPGDVLLVQPADLESPARFPAEQPVLQDGTILLGRYGMLSVVGRTIPEIELLARALIEAQTKDAGPIVVRPINRQSKVYYVLGEVNAPGAFTLAGRETVLDGILAAGGLTTRGSQEKIILSRPTLPDDCRVVLPVDYEKIVQHGDTRTNYQLAPGDRIYVPTRCLLE